MKRYLLISIIIHLIFIALFFLLPKKKDKEQKPFYAQIVTPEEIKKQQPPPPAKPSKAEQHQQGRIRINETRRPDKWSAIAKGPHPAKSAGKQKDDDRTLRPTPQKQDDPSQKGYRTVPSDAAPQRSAKKMHSRDQLFDQDVIGSVSRQNTKSNAITFDTTEYRYYGYMQRLREKLESIWQYPPEAIARKLYGDLIIEFTIKKNGQLGAVQLIRTSGYRILDDAALKALRDADPYWPLPEGIKQESITIRGNFIYIPDGRQLK